MPMLSLNRRTVAKLPSIDKRTVYRDTTLPGFALSVSPPSNRSPEGSATWILRYRDTAGGRGAKVHHYTIGSLSVIPADQARTIAEIKLAEARLGTDHAAVRKEARAAPTVAQLAIDYQAATDAKRKASTLVAYKGYWRLHILPALGNQRACEVTATQLARLHSDIGVDHRVTANRVTTLLCNFYNWAAKTGRVPEGCNPAAGIERFKEQGRERYLTDIELARLGAAIREAETTGIDWARVASIKPLSKHAPAIAENRREKIAPEAAAAMRLLIFTGARLREILHLKWQHVDMQRGLLFLPDSKSGAKTVVLGMPAIALLAEIRARAEAEANPEGVTRIAATISEYVLPGVDPKKPRADLQRPWSMVRRRAGLSEVRLHDLRHTFGSAGAGAGLGLPIIGNLLGHKNVETTRRYAHLDSGPLKRAADAISGSLAAALLGSTAA